MRNTIIIAVISLVVAGCSKDKFTTKPQLKFKKFNSNFIPRDQALQITLSFTDLEGDLPDTLFIQRRSRACAGDTSFKTFERLPDFPSGRNLEGDIFVSYSNGIIPGQKPMSDVPGSCADTTLCYFRFALKDKAGNVSDTLETPEVAISKF